MRKLFFAVAALTASLLFSCGGASDQPASASNVKTEAAAAAAATVPDTTAKSASVPAPDLSSPPPGSQATPEKWATFDEAKRKDAWNKYLSEAAPVAQPTSETQQAATQPAAAPVTTSTTKTGGSIPVVVGNLSIAPMELYYYGLGEVEAGRTTRVSPPANGTAVSVYVSAGDFVEEGDLLFSMDNGEGTRTIERASEKWSTELELAQVHYNEARQALETSNQLFTRDLVTKVENDKARQLAEETRLALEKVQVAKTTELDTLKENYRALIATSPHRGYVTSLSFSRGESVNTADYVEIANLETVLITVGVPENVIARVSQGALVRAKQASAADYNLEGNITSRSMVADTNRAYEVRALLENKDQRLLPGMLMETRIQVAQLNPRIVVPRETIVYDGGAMYIFVIDNGVARKIPVQTGASRGGFVQISGTIQEGQKLVLEGQSFLQNGASVRISETRTYLPERMDF